MSHMVEVQRRAFVAQATDAAAILASRLKPLSPAQQAAILAIVTKESNAPVDLVLLGERGDERECSEILDGVLDRSSIQRTAWKLGSGCLFTLSILPGEEEGR